MRVAITIFWLYAAAAAPAAAATWYVAAGGTGTGTSASPFGSIQAGINAAQPGDVVVIGAGSYSESLRTVRSGSAASRITVRAAGSRGSVVVSVSGRVLTVAHEYVTVDGLVLDGRYGADDTVRVNSTANGFTLNNSEVRRSSRDGIDMGGPSGVLIVDSLIHHTLNAAGGRTDAHGIVAGAVHGLTIRNTEIHTFSGDAVQIDPSRSSPGWDDVRIEGCRLWLAPLPSAENGFPAGTVPGENAVDTKSSGSFARARITIRNTEAWGFQNGLLTHMAAFNLKENVDAALDGVTVWDSEIAFRVRGAGTTLAAGAWARVQNAVVHHTGTAFRYEDAVENLRAWNVTIGNGVGLPFQSAGASAAGVAVQNLLLLGSALPPEASGSTSLAVPASAFVDASKNNYQLASGSSAVDAGVAIAQVTTDRQGTLRPQGLGYDIGAFERPATSTFDPGEIVEYAGKAAVVVGDWTVTADRSAAGGLLIRNPDRGAALLKDALAVPASYFELSFYAEAGRPYRLWLRGRADGDRKANDSVFVQFTGSVDSQGSAVYRIGTTSATIVTLADCGSCSLAGWGWQDNKSGAGALGPVIYFGTTGIQRVRVQPREDGLSIDQIVMSASDYLITSPGSPTKDATILQESIAH